MRSLCAFALVLACGCYTARASAPCELRRADWPLVASAATSVAGVVLLTAAAEHKSSLGQPGMNLRDDGPALAAGAALTAAGVSWLIGYLSMPATIQSCRPSR